MKTRALAMPEYVAELVRLPLARMGLEPNEAKDDIVTCPLAYEDTRGDVHSQTRLVQQREGCARCLNRHAR